MQGLGGPLAAAAVRHPAATAVRDGERSVTYAELARRVRALGGGLDSLEIPRGARIGVLAANSLAHLECFFGVPAAGRVVVSLNFRLDGEELAVIARDAALRVLVCDAECLEVARGLVERCATIEALVLAAPGPVPAGAVAYEDLVEGKPGPDRPIAPDDVAAISFTGGTTGQPKGVMLSHRNLLANARHNLAATGHEPTDRWLHVCPMFHVAGTANVVAATWAGAEQVVLPRFEAGAVLSTIAGAQITHVALVPTMIGMLLDHPAAPGADLSSLRHVQYAASPISPALQARLLERVSCDVAQFYGMTEAAPTVSHCTPEDHRRGHADEEPWAGRLRSMGAPVPGVSVELRDAAGNTVAPGQVGEIWVSGLNVMLGYLDQPEASAAALIDGWYRTGDVARADADGYLTMVDRLKDMIITGAENVYSVEVELVLAQHPAVREAAVFGVPDARWGESVHAVVALAPGGAVEDGELQRFCRERIGAFKVPRSLEIRREPLPRSGAGKVLKHALRAPHWAARERGVS